MGYDHDHYGRASKNYVLAYETYVTFLSIVIDAAQGPELVSIVPCAKVLECSL